jgi:hypothetical protein
LDRRAEEIKSAKLDAPGHYSGPAGLDPGPGWGGLSAIAESLTDHAKILEIDDTLAPIEDVAVRRKLFLRPVLWSNVCRGGYAERPLLRQKIVQDFEGFLAESDDCAAALQLPVFWIGGRSGDGKSVLLLQLCRIVKQVDPARPVALFDTPDDLLDWIETVALAGKLPTGAPLLLVVVDDLHKVADWERARDVLERAATQEARLAILTCGPSPERALFVEASQLQSCLALMKSDTTMLRPQDAEVIADHLGIELDADAGPKPTLVERVFLTLSGEASIDNFARSLKERIDTRVNRDDLLKQLTAMAWLDLPLPRALASFDEAAWLEVLAGETQLHISTSEDGFRFGHPAIARPIFEALTRAGSQTPTLTTRIAQVLSQLLNDLSSPLLITRILRQMMARLNADAEIDLTEVLNHVFSKATGARAKAAAVAFLVYQLTKNDEEIGQYLYHLARTYRGNASLEPPTRAFLARNLVFAKNAEDRDLRAALDLVADPNVGPYMGVFLDRLATKTSRERGWTFQGIQPATNWVRKHPEQPVAQDVLCGFLSQYPKDSRLQAAALDLVRIISTKQALSSKFMSLVAKYLEDQLKPELCAWLTKFIRRPVSTDVLVALLKKPGDKWDGFAQQHLDAVRSDDPTWQAAIATLLPHVHTNHLADHVRRIARERVGAPATDRSAGGLFTSLAERAKELGAEDLVCDRLDVLWQPENLAEIEGERQAYHLLGTAWGKLADRRDSFSDRARHLFDRLSEIEREAASQRPSNKRKKHRNPLRHGATMILQSFEHARLCAWPALTFRDAWPNDELSGMAVAHLVALGATMVEEDDPELVKELRRREKELTAACWAWARTTQGPRILCTQALLRTRWDAETDAVRALIRGFWYPGLQFGADRVLQSWLRDPRCTNEAWDFLLDRSIDRESYDKLRAGIVARNIDYTFERLRTGDLSREAQTYLLRLLEMGVSDHETNAAAAWAALQRREIWPPEAEAALWRGILRSALEGFTLREEEYRPHFDAWQAVNHDSNCEAIIAEACSAVAT